MIRAPLQLLPLSRLHPHLHQSAFFFFFSFFFKNTLVPEREINGTNCYCLLVAARMRVSLLIHATAPNLPLVQLVPLPTNQPPFHPVLEFPGFFKSLALHCCC